jgi:hypothetical protein
MNMRKGILLLVSAFKDASEKILTSAKILDASALKIPGFILYCTQLVLPLSGI